MPFLLPNQQCQSTEGGKISHSMDLLTPSSPGGLPTLSLTTNSSWLPWGRVAMPLISPLMPVPQFKWCTNIYIAHSSNTMFKRRTDIYIFHASNARFKWRTNIYISHSSNARFKRRADIQGVPSFSTLIFHDFSTTKKWKSTTYRHNIYFQVNDIQLMNAYQN